MTHPFRFRLRPTESLNADGPLAQSILSTVAQTERDPLTTVQLAARLSEHPQAITPHLERLEQEGYVEERIGTWWLTPDGWAFLRARR